MTLAHEEPRPPESLRSDPEHAHLWIPRIAGVFLVVQAVLVAMAVSTTWFKQDDFALLWLASSDGGFPSTLFQSWNGHVIPGQLSLYAANHALFGMNWTSVVIIASGMQLAASYLAWRVFRSLFGLRLFTLGVLAVYLTSIPAFVTLMWWANFGMWMPLQIGFPAATLLLQRALRTRRTLDAFLPALAMATTCMFFEKGITIVPFLIVLVACVPLVAGAPPRAIDRLRNARLPLGIVTIGGLCYLSAYQILSHNDPYRPGLTIPPLDHFDLGPVLRVFLPSFLGGTWPVGLPLFAAGYQPTLEWEFRVAGDGQTVFVSVLFICMVAWSAWTYRRSVRYWLAGATFTLVTLLLVIASRRSFMLNPRYYAEILFPVLVFFSLALRPSETEHDRLRRTAAARHMSGRSRGIAASMAFIAVALLATYNANDVRDRLSSAPAEKFIATALATSKSHSQPVTLIRQYVGPDLVNGILLPDYNFTEFVLRPAGGPWRFADHATDPYMVLDDGTVVPARSSQEMVPLYEPGACNIDLADGVPQRLTLNADPISWKWYGSVSTSAQSAVVMTVEWNDEPVTFPISEGLRNTTFFLPGGGNSIRLTATGGDVCVSGIGFGGLVPR